MCSLHMLYSSTEHSLVNEFFETDAKKVVQCLSILLPKLFTENEVDMKSIHLLTLLGITIGKFIIIINHNITYGFETPID